MGALLRKLTLHLLAATSVPLAVAAALAGLGTLAGWFESTSFEQRLIYAAMPVLGAVAIAMYPFYFVQIIRTYLRSRGPLHLAAPPGPPPSRTQVTREHWDNVGLSVVVFLLLIGIGRMVGLPAEDAHADRLTYYVFLWLERGTLFIGAAGLVFSIALMTTHALRGVLWSFAFAANSNRLTERRRNLPLDVALAALPVFVALLVV